jgi:hypothetical protein
MLDAIEAIAGQAGAQRLALNVFGASHGAIALYTARGYAVTMQQMAKELGEAQR